MYQILINMVNIIIRYYRKYNPGKATEYFDTTNSLIEKLMVIVIDKILLKFKMVKRLL